MEIVDPLKRMRSPSSPLGPGFLRRRGVGLSSDIFDDDEFRVVLLAQIFRR